MSLNNPIILISSGRAGSTIFSEVLFRHKKIGFPSNYNEKFPFFPAISGIRNIFDNRFYRKIGIKKQQYNAPGFSNKIMFTPSEAWAMWEYITGPDINFSRDFLLGRQASHETIERIRKYFREILFWQSKKRLAFKITGPSRLEFLHSIFPDAKFIRIIRNPYATVFSFLNAPFWKRQGISQLWWLGAYSNEEIELVQTKKDNPIWMTAFQLKRVLETTNQEILKLGIPVTEVVFEDFITDPVAQTKTIFNSLDLEFDQYCNRYFKEVPIQKNVNSYREAFSVKEMEILNHFFNDASCIS